MALEYPIVEGLDENLSALDYDEYSGAFVVVWVNFDGLENTRVVELNWQVTAQGDSAGDYRSAQDVDPTDLDPVNGMRFRVPPSALLAGYNLPVGLDYSADGQRSPRRQFLLGRPRPVVMARQAYGLVIARDEAASDTTLQWTLPPYTAMRAGDVVTLKVVSDPATFGLPWDDLPYTVQAGDEGLPIVWQADTTYLLLTEERLDAHVTVEHATAAGQRATSSAFTLQHYQVQDAPPATPEWLPDAELPGAPGDTLDPGDHPEGLRVRLPVPASLREDDAVLLHWRGPDRASSQVLYWRVDASVVGAGEITGRIAHAVLAAGVGSDARLSWQFARPGAAGHSPVKVLHLRAATPLPAPVVIEANDNGEVAASSAPRGLRVRVPELQGQVTNLTVHYDGHPDGGQYTADSPESERVFRIPPEVLPPNMGAKYYPVYYTATFAGTPRQSPSYSFRVTPLANSVLANIECAQAPGGSPLSITVLRNQHNGVANVSQRPWLFYGEGQQISIIAKGLLLAGGVSSHTIFDGPTSDDSAGLKGLLPVSYLQTLRRPQALDIDVTVTFGGDGARLSKKTTLQLVD